MRTTISIIVLVLSFLLGEAQPLPPGAPAVIITEILYDMPGTADTLEFVELTNPSDTNERSLAGYSFAEGIEFTFPAGLIVEPSEVVVVAKDAGAMFRTFGVDAYQWESGDLSDSGELIVFNNNFGLPADSVNYQTNLLWPDASDNGNSIVFCNDTLPNTGPVHWSAANTNTGVNVGGTLIYANPGTNCSGWIGVQEKEWTSVSVYPNPSNGQLRVELPEILKGQTELSVVDATGRTVYENRLSSSGSSLLNLNLQLENGIYTLLIQFSESNYYSQIVIME